MGDSRNEPDERFFVNLNNPVNAVILDDQGEGLIVNDDFAQPVATITNIEQREGNAGTTAFVFTVQLDNVPSSASTVDFSTADGTAVAGTDYIASSGQLQFPPGETEQTIEVAVIGDSQDEIDQQFFVNLTNPDGLIIGDDQAMGTILDDDDPAVTVQIHAVGNIDDPTGLDQEGNSGQSTFRFNVGVLGRSDGAVTVQLATQDGTATAGEDYQATSATLTFPSGTITQTFDVTVFGDRIIETDEFFFATIESISGATAPDPQATGTIIADDAVVIRDEGLQLTEMVEQELSQFVLDRLGLAPDFGRNILADLNVMARPEVLDQIGRDIVITISTANREAVSQIFSQLGVQVTTAVQNRIDQAINQARRDLTDEEVLQRMTELAVDVAQTLDITNALVLLTDPVNAVLTDPAGRSNGFTEPTGVVGQTANTFYSGDGAAELLVIPQSQAGLYNLQLEGVGNGNFRAVAVRTDGSGVVGTEQVSGQLLGNLDVVLDFNAAVPVSTVAVPVSTVGPATTAAVNEGIFSIPPFTPESSDGGEEVQASAVRQKEIADAAALLAMILADARAIADALSKGFAGLLSPLFPGDTVDSGPREAAPEDLSTEAIDLVWRVLADGLIGVSGTVADDVLQLIQPLINDDESSDNDTQSDNDGTLPDDGTSDDSTSTPNDATEPEPGDGDDQARVDDERRRRWAVWNKPEEDRPLKSPWGESQSSRREDSATEA